MASLRLVTGVVGLSAASALLPSVATAATPTVNCANTDLQTVVDHAKAGATILVSGHCKGNVVFSRDITLTGHPTATLDALNAGPAVEIPTFDVVHLSNLVITRGSTTIGGGIFAPFGSVLTLDHVTVKGNTASTWGGGIGLLGDGVLTVRHSTISGNTAAVSAAGAQDVRGGGIFVVGALSLQNSSVTGNVVSSESTDDNATGTGGGVDADGPVTISNTTFSTNTARAMSTNVADSHGGAIYWAPEDDHVLSISGSTFVSNQASIDVPNAASADGGAISASASAGSAINITHSAFTKNSVSDKTPGSASDGFGGAINVSSQPKGLALSITDSSITHSLLQVTSPVPDAEGGALRTSGVATSISGSTIANNKVVVHGTAGSDPAVAAGGAIRSDNTIRLLVHDSTIADNAVQGDGSSQVVQLAGGGLHVTGAGPFRMEGSTVSGNAAVVTNGGSGSGSTGGGLDLGSAATDRITNSTIAGNSVRAVSPSPSAIGAGIASYDTALQVRYSTVARNTATATGAGSVVRGGGLYDGPGTHTSIVGTILALNKATTGRDCSGSMTSAGYNLLSTKAGCTLPTKSGDRVSGAPKLGSLAHNGWPTETLALLKGSPALNRVPKGICHSVVEVDQRDVRRPQGKRCDIGAYEKRI